MITNMPEGDYDFDALHPAPVYDIESAAGDPSRFIRFRVSSNFPIDFGNGRGTHGMVTFPGQAAIFWQHLIDKHGATMIDLLKDLARFYWWYMAATDRGQVYYRPYDAAPLDDATIKHLGFEPVEFL